MITKQLGQTGIAVPEIGLGTYNYKGDVAPLRKGLEAGALFIDTAESYGTEPLAGEAMAGIRDRVFLATKVSPGHFRKAEVMQAADRSLRALRTDWIDLYQLHAPDPTVPIEETLGAMEELVDAGKVRFIGVSNFFLGDLKRAQRAMRKHRIAANQMCYNLTDRSVEPELLAYCRQAGISVIAYSPLARGLPSLLQKDPNGILSQIAGETGKTAVQVAINWCLRHDHVFAIPKGNSAAHVLEICGASDWRLSPAQIELLTEQIRFRRRTVLEAVVRRLLSRSAQEKISQLLQRLRGGGKPCGVD
jgi:diketogulonate reductase-like aldo/keto reductase